MKKSAKSVKKSAAHTFTNSKGDEYKLYTYGRLYFYTKNDQEPKKGEPAALPDAYKVVVSRSGLPYVQSKSADD